MQVATSTWESSWEASKRLMAYRRVPKGRVALLLVAATRAAEAFPKGQNFDSNSENIAINAITTFPKEQSSVDGGKQSANIQIYGKRRTIVQFYGDDGSKEDTECGHGFSKFKAIVANLDKEARVTGK